VPTKFVIDQLWWAGAAHPAKFVAVVPAKAGTHGELSKFDRSERFRLPTMDSRLRGNDEMGSRAEAFACRENETHRVIAFA
jgi:hypothetical protein